MLPPLAHEKWFEEDRYSADWDFLFDTATVLLLIAAIAGAVIWRLVARRLNRPEIGALGLFGRLAPWVPRLLGIHLGVSLLSLAVGNDYLAPSLSLDDVPLASVIAIVEGFLGVWLISGIRLRGAAVGVIALGPLALAIAGPVAVLEAADLLGMALFLFLLPPGRDRYGAARSDPGDVALPVWVLKVCLGVALVIVALSEKLLNPRLASEFLEANPGFDIFELIGIGLSDEAFIRFAGAVEILFGLLIISAAAPQVVVILVGIPFNATLFFLGRTELIGHLPIYGAMLALLVYGSSRDTARVVPDLIPGPLRRPSLSSSETPRGSPEAPS